ncbi:hypothetical protein J8273_6929 [Carpediemonas membranifera]|uniref:Uncharacterized protein n=1 Tax=Carpediemonas membranifera TaxID=201153 RepID=A0A8J6B0Z6_9EUKA|nr:hypothetical protein J8273_6929 [Carpediemonas membranifera]|eukprot:KAG9390692.1 hypothetical protein J8273_6929 [Carpediemonas membranifera]
MSFNSVSLHSRLTPHTWHPLYSAHNWRLDHSIIVCHVSPVMTPYSLLPGRQTVALSNHLQNANNNVMPGDKPNKTMSDSLKEAKDQIKDATVETKDRVVDKAKELKDKVSEKIGGKKETEEVGVKLSVEREKA